jgi:hypothetical protein
MLYSLHTAISSTKTKYRYYSVALLLNDKFVLKVGIIIKIMPFKTIPVIHLLFACILIVTELKRQIMKYDKMKKNVCLHPLFLVECFIHLTGITTTASCIKHLDSLTWLKLSCHNYVPAMITSIEHCLQTLFLSIVMCSRVS